jgi:two-component system, NarL family, sensor kinase
VAEKQFPISFIRAGRLCWLLRASVLITGGLAWLIGLFTPAAIAGGGEPSKPKEVLLLYSYRHLMPINAEWDRGIRGAIESAPEDPVTIDIEYLDFLRLNNRDYREQWLDLLRSKYGEVKPDVVIPVHDLTAEFLIENHRRLFPDAAVVFCSISEKTRDRLPLTSQMTGVVYRLDFQSTLACARRLLPRTQRVIVLSGSGEIGLALVAGAKAAFAAEKQINFAYWVGTPVDELRARVSRLPSDSVILFLAHDVDQEGRFSTSSSDVLRSISSVASVPIFGLYDTLLGEGIVGGCLAPVEAQGRRAGEVAVRVLRGESPRDIPFTGTEMNRYAFDSRQLRRWGIRERNLPEGSRVAFGERSLWEQYWGYITTGTAAILLQSLLIGALLVNRRKRLRAEHSLADRLQFETSLSGLSARFVDVVPKTVAGEIECALEQVTNLLALDRGTVFEVSSDELQLRATLSWVRAGQSQAPTAIPLDSIPWLWAKLSQGCTVHFSSVSELPAEAAQERALMMRLGLKAGVAVPLKAKGTILGMLSFGQLSVERPWNETVLNRLKLVGEVVANALAHARADESLCASREEARQLAGRLLTAQEDERRRLAREMHDDVTQRLAATAIAAGKFEQQFPAADPSRTAMASLKDQLIALSDDVHRISRQLHPAILDDLGLEDALRSECDRFAEREGVVTHFHCGDLPDGLPKDIALCLYRIAQEALRNVAKHAQTDRVELVLNADAELLDLEIRDFGRGFFPEEVRCQPGLGLASMEERTRLVGGELTISSVPGQGTSIAVRIPLLEDDT